VARPNSTIVVIVGDGARRVIGGLVGLANVHTQRTADEPGVSATELIGRSSGGYLVHDNDPLAAVGTAWTEYFDGRAPQGSVEVAVEAVLADLRRGAVLLPDYYVVLSPGTLAETWRHWWLGVLAGAAPSRVLPADDRPDTVRDLLSGLPSGRWWPDPPDEWLRGLNRVVPDKAGLAVG
jgi:hypothetical protein